MADAQERIGQSIGDYRLLRLLGQGRFGTVYLAEQRHEHISAAVKVLSMPLTGPNNFDVFLKETRTVRLHHPHIVSLFDFDLTRDGLPYLAMTYADEGSLRDRYPKGSKLSFQTIDTYVQQLAPALQYAHDCHVIHHDIKPENMLVSSNGTVQLSDFAIAKISGRVSLYTQPQIVGTPAYTAPEQCQGQPCPASDQYALAIVVYEWLTGQCPFQGDSFAVASQHQMDTPPSLSSINSEVPPQVEQVILRALTKAPKDRFPTITYFAEALHTTLQEDDEPTQTHLKATLVELSTSGEVGSDCELSSFPQSVGGCGNELDTSQSAAVPAAPVPLPDAPSPQVIPPEPPPAPADTTFPAQLVGHLANKWLLPVLRASLTSLFRKAAQLRDDPPVLASPPDTDELHNSPPIGQPQYSSTLAKDRLKKMIQHQPVDGGLARLLRLPTTASQPPRPLPTWMRLIGSLLIVVIIGGGFATVLHLLSTQSVSPTQKGGTTVVNQAATRYHIPAPTPSPQHQIPTPTPSPQNQIPTPTPSVISPAIPVGRPLYSTPYPFSACDKLGGHWVNTSDARVTCNPDGSEMVNTSGHLAVANLDQLGINQSSWPSQNCIVQVQVTINPNSHGVFGIDFQSDTGDNTPAYFAYLLNPPDNWTFNYYNTPGTLTNTLISTRLISSVSTKLTIDIRVEGTYYTFYVNGADTKGRAFTGSQYINKIVGLAVDANADITFADLAIYALP